MHESSRCDTGRGLQTGGSLSDADFSGFLGACKHELAAKQAVFQQRIQGSARWFYDMTDFEPDHRRHRLQDDTDRHLQFGIRVVALCVVERRFSSHRTTGG